MIFKIRPALTADLWEIDHVFKQNLDTISVAHSLFKGTVVDFNDGYQDYGGKGYATQLEKH